MSEKRRGLGRGLGALIPSTTTTVTGADRPVDVFFPGRDKITAIPAPPVLPVPVEPAPTEAGPSTPDAVPTEAAPETETTDADPSVSRETSTPQDVPAVEVSRETSADLLPVPGARFAEIPVGHIVPNPRQPRTIFDEDELAELVHSVREIGVLQPIVVRAVEGTADRYELIMGERRWRASQDAGLATVPAIVRDTADDDLLRDALLENLHRSQLNPLEEAAAYNQLLDDFGCTHDELASRIGRSRPQISNTLRLLKLPPLVQRRVAAGVLSAGHARALLGLAEGAAMERLAQRIVAEGLSVRAVEEIVSLGLDDAPAVRAKRPRAGGRRAELDDLAQRLSDRFDTRVQIALGQRKGRLSVEFASVDDLNRIVSLLAPGDAAFVGGDGQQPTP